MADLNVSLSAEDIAAFWYVWLDTRLSAKGHSRSHTITLDRKHRRVSWHHWTALWPRLSGRLIELWFLTYRPVPASDDPLYARAAAPAYPLH